MYTKDEVLIEGEKLPQSFAYNFDAKIQNINEEGDIDDSMYNGKKKLISTPNHFMG
jgi:hypothetical protein